MTFTEAVQSVSSSCETRSQRLAKIKALLDATEEAMFNSAVGGVVKQYRVDTGQSVVSVEATDFKSLKDSWRDLNSLYNEMCGIASGSNVMAVRSTSTIYR